MFYSNHGTYLYTQANTNAYRIKISKKKWEPDWKMFVKND